MSLAESVLVVGCGFAGATSARVLADAGFQVRCLDKREHIGGNAYDEYDPNGILIHRYGPHIFHTNADRIFEWLSAFTDWRSYEHRVLASVDGQLVPIPINRTTLNRLYSLNLSESEVEGYLDSVRVPIERIRTSEDVVLNSVGPELCDKFFRGYTRKQWGLDLSELSAGVAARIPTRTNDDDRYFTDTHQAMPLEGYTAMFENILNHPNITVELGVDYFQLKDEVHPLHTIYTGPIDVYYGYRYGALPYRSLFFEHEHLTDKEWFQTVGTVNYPNDHAYTRITEFKHLTGQIAHGTSVVREYPRAEGDPYYPIPRPENEARYQEYKQLAEQEADVTFVGRLAQYRYYNMDQVVAAALKSAQAVADRLAS